MTNMSELKFVFILFIFITCATAKASISLSNLNVEYEHEPLGVNVNNPRFSWLMVADNNQRGCFQKAYQLIVSDEFGEIAWDSGKVKSDESLNITYAGFPLKPTTTYNWAVKVWDQNDNQHTSESWFETGLMSPDDSSSAWNGAQWIGCNKLVLYAHYLPVYKINYTLQLDEVSKTTKAAFVYGANDYRLLDKNKNLYNLENEKDRSYIAVEIDIAGLQKNKNASLNIYRAGYHPDDLADIPFETFEIPLHVINVKNKYDNHTIYITSEFGRTRIYIDGSEKEQQVAELNLNPIGAGGDFITFPVLAEIGYKVSPEMNAFFSDIGIRNYRMPSNALFSDNKIHKISGERDGILQTKNINQHAVPMLRTVFDSDKSSKIEKARLYVTSRGIYEVYMNGNRIGSDYFNPGLSQYNKTHFYHVYDVTPFVLPGENALGAILSEGWWSGGMIFRGDTWNYFGDRQSLLAKLVITYSDGKEKVVATNPDSWNCYSEGPVLYGSFFQGEVYDATKDIAIEGWSIAGYDDGRWVKASLVPLEGNASPMHDNAAVSEIYNKMQLISDIGLSPQKVKELTAVSVEEVRPGVYVYDMGQNMVGVPKIKLSGCMPGKKITMRFAEMLYPDLPEYKGRAGMLMLENLRAAMAQDIYITKGGEELVNPRFTFHGYRYIEITGISSPLPINDVKGDVISSVHDLSSSYETSNTDVNKLWENITWSMHGNFLSIPTDCPQRNERAGWSGDISVFSPTATYLSNIQPFLNRHMRAMRDLQREDGRFPDIAPVGYGFGGILWGSAGIIVAWENYLQYNDKQLLIDHYDAMKDYMNFLLEKCIDVETGILVQDEPGAWGNLGDWLSLEDNRNDRTLLWEAYFIYDLEIMSKIATVLNEKEDTVFFNKLHQERKDFFNKTYIDSSSGKTIHSGGKQFGEFESKKGQLIDTQTSYALPLAFGLIPEENRDNVLKNFKETILRDNVTDDGKRCPPYSLMTGFIGTAWINKALSGNECTDIAYRLLQQTTYPSWLYSVKQGATTIWERLNSYTHSEGFGGNNQMNSFNHYSFGSVGAWMYNHSLGIERDENYPGFKHFILKPKPDPSGNMKYAKGYYDSMYGRIESSWEIKGDECHYQFAVPANTTATLYLESSSTDNIAENGIPVSEINGIVFLEKNAGKCIYTLKSGVYNFIVK